ncbi:major facilitator superfamily MFS_1 [Ruminiclostridium papyrosolvens DSM 2782]|uniref:Major facilitator superfamily MFS_1 n=1 Tax=Ruminiclostridium papyrosolvens DSM 2782 TaxID=588581 RepID=F1TA68_9FIRM|nr:MFS transporter [Ruminiclostridium papyrosolvens]EGD48810.1 major facilitator superfamily MFS_1 [Ruminiclostridium papyrosolvens DSM 2782]WES32436.1 MFS transporter [Ruminiclostridium papyrosolvens DSM 2782]
MIKKIKANIRELHTFLLLWITQSFSTLGSAMTNFALVIWSYQQQGSALTTSLLAICSYAPYVLLSIFAGALSDRWNKKTTMLISDSFAAFCTVSVLLLLTTGKLQIWHLYLINTLNGLMNTVQQPASEVTVSLLTPKKHYQKVSGMRSFSNSLVTILTPVIATALLSFTSIKFVILFDLITYFTAFVALLCFIKIPKVIEHSNTVKETVLQSAKSGFQYLKDNRGILDLILFLAVINFTASIFNAALPAMMLSRTGGGEVALGMVNTVTGIATLVGSILVSVLPPPKSRVRVICNSLLFAMSTENFILAFGRSTWVWCLGATLGWIFIPVMGANMDVLFRSKIPIEMQGRVYSVRNTLQFFTIPLGYLCGGIFVDRVFEPFMAEQPISSIWVTLFGSGKGSGAALLFFVIGIFGSLSCLPFRRDKHIWKLEK